MTHQLNFIYNDSDWVCPSEYPDLSNAKDIAIDLETKDPYIKTKGAGWATFEGHIVGFANENSDQKELIDFLISHQTKKEFSFSFSWRKGDIAIWANKSILHAATAFNGDRKMFRITIQ